MHTIWYNRIMKLAKLQRYSENNRIEAKRATGGFPQSVWETYSAFANTLGGVILLGVEEKKDYSLRAVTLPDPEGLAEELWRGLNDEKKVSANILSRGQVKVEEVDGKKIVVITVPRANRREKPIYIGSTPYGGSYRRSGEGDYKCSAEEVQAMLAERERVTPDMRLLEELPLSALREGDLRSYRKRARVARPYPAYEEKTDGEFFRLAGVVGVGKSGALHPTVAGLLSFGKRREIERAFPNFRLEYRENGEVLVGENLYEFYENAGARVCEGLPERIKKALLEGLVNALVNADYEQGGVLAARTDGEIRFVNAGGFRIDLHRAKTGGVTDPRNESVARLFQLVEIAEGVGGGIPHIYAVWRETGWSAPEIIEEALPPRILLRLPLKKDARATRKPHSGLQRELLISYLTEHALASAEELVSLLGDLRAAEELVDEGIVVKKGGRYALKR